MCVPLIGITYLKLGTVIVLDILLILGSKGQGLGLASRRRLVSPESTPVHIASSFIDAEAFDKGVKKPTQLFECSETDFIVATQKK